MGHGGILAVRPGVAATFWNLPAAFDLFGTVFVYFGEALLVVGLVGNGGHA